MSKKMKSFLVCIMLTLCSMITACASDPASYYFNYDELKEKVVRIELIDYDNSDAKTVKKKADILPFDFDKMRILETLETGQYDDLLSDFSKIHFHIRDDLTRYLNSANGISVKINYANGDFVVFCLRENIHFVGEFTENGDVGELMLYYVFSSNFTSFSDFVDLFNKYFETQID